VRAIGLRQRELRDAAETLKETPGCDPKVWDAHIKHLEDLANRTRQMADWARTPGQTTGTDPREAERVADEAKRQLDEARSLRAGDCPKSTPKVVPEIRGLTSLPPYNVETGKPYSTIVWLRMRSSWALDDVDEAFYYCDEDWLDALYPRLERLIAETEAIIASGTLSKEDAEDAKDMLDALKDARIGSALFYCPKYKPLEYVRVYLERLARGEEGPGTSTILPKEPKRLAEPQSAPGQAPTFEPMGTTGGGMSFPARPAAAAPVPMQFKPVFDMVNRERTGLGLQPLTWSEEAAASAGEVVHEMALSGILGHSSRNGRATLRENLSQGLITETPYDMAHRWLDEKRYFRSGLYPNVCYDSEGHVVDWSKCSHYSMMIWWTTISMGCALDHGHGFNWLACDFDPGGNKDDRPVGAPSDSLEQAFEDYLGQHPTVRAVDRQNYIDVYRHWKDPAYPLHLNWPPPPPPTPPPPPPPPP
jgi:hypothetical protein